jgi:hypothetical protein
MAGCVALNLFQSYQYDRGIIDGDRMTRPYYFKAFGKLSVSDEERRLLLIKRSFDGVEHFDNENEYSKKLLVNMDFESKGKQWQIRPHGGSYVFRTDTANIYSTPFELPYRDITQHDHAWIRVTGYVYPVVKPTTESFGLVVHFTHKGYAYKYTFYDAEKMKLQAGKWNKVVVDYLTPEVRRKSDQLKIYFMNQGKTPVYVDDMRIEAFETK